MTDGTDKLAMEITNLRDTIFTERKQHNATEEIEDHLRKTRKLFQERELVIAEREKHSKMKWTLFEKHPKRKKSLTPASERLIRAIGIVD